MSFTGSGGDDQSEDGELRHSPTEVKAKEDVLDFSLSEEDQDTADSLDIKPPQASRVAQSATSSRTKRRERTREGRSRHGRSERHREERSHGHREKRHREHATRDREKYEREYREKDHFREVYREKDVYVSKAEGYRDVRYNSEVYRREHEGSSREGRLGYEGREKRSKDTEKYAEKESRYESEKSRKYDDRQESRRVKSYADQTLDDLRERLLDKRRIKETSDEYRYEKESRRKTKVEVEMEESEMYVKEIIDLSTTDEVREPKREKHHHHRREREVEKEEIKEEDEKDERKVLTDAEREEQEMRKEKLLEAEREIARQKEQYLLDRERRHKLRQERQEAKRKLALEQQQNQAKRQRMTGELGQYKDKDLSIVTVSDNSSESSSEENEDAHSDESDRSDDSESSKSRDDSDKDSTKYSDNEDYRERSPSIERRDKSDRSRTNSPSRSPSRSRSKSPSPTTNGEASKAKSKSPTPPKKILDSDLPPYFPAIQGCRSVEEFQCLNRIEEGTYGVVYRARDKRTDEIVALKRLKMEKEKEGFPITSLREINTLLKGQHPNIVTVREIVVGSNMDKIFIVMDYVEHDLKSLMETMRHKKQVFVPGEVKCLLKQLLGAVAHLHDNWILHRDLKTSNLLLSHKGILKVGDFGLAREYGSPLKAYTPIVVTLWYRAPELLLCCKEYSTPIDLWSVGCIFAELLLMNALFPGKSEVDQLNRIFKELGTPNEKIWPGYNELPAVKKMKFTEYPVSQLRNRFQMLSELGQNMLQRFLTYDPAQRVTAEEAMKHPYFTEAPLPIDPAMFPTWPAKSELGHRKALATSPRPPSGGREYKQLGDGDEDSALGFHMGSTSSASLMESRRLAMGGGFSLKF